MYSLYFTFLDGVKAISVHRAHRLLSESTLILRTPGNRLSVIVNGFESASDWQLKETVPVALLCRPLYLAGIEIVIAFDDPHLRSELAELSLTSNFLRDLSVIFMNGVGERVALFSFGCSHRGLNIANQWIDVTGSWTSG